MKRQDLSRIRTNNSDHLNDWNLFISNGSKNAFSRIYNDYFDILYNLGIKFSTDSQIIENSIQNLFSYLLKKRERLTPVTNLRSYLIKSFRNQLFKDLKKQKKLVLPDQITDSQFDYYSSTEQVIIENEEIAEMQNALKKCLNKLNSKQQELIYLRFDCEMSYKEIASILDITVEACYKSIYRLIKIIKKDIEKADTRSRNFFLWFIHRLESSL
ncbi:RNA polymerase sigma factor [Sunxiuqinia indica]|uniref:RNA polymerase sigma factor n=1 Tax=Sunxiuqinia indica TaxID=2692584 RepID=UPI001F1C1F6E|nr:sigma-70 family RNA polymerase sigma factor [Sunxiuqinia indica]